MPLTDTTIKNAKPRDKAYKIADEKGMFLLVNLNGSKYFRLKYRFAKQEKSLALGVYPDTTLKQARDKRDAAKKQLAVNPLVQQSVEWAIKVNIQRMDLEPPQALCYMSKVSTQT